MIICPIRFWLPIVWVRKLMFNFLKGGIAKLKAMYFFSPTCGPCKSVGPIIEELSEKHEFNLRKIDVSVGNNHEIAQKEGVSGLPFIKFFSKNKPAGSINGNSGRDAKKKIEQMVIDILKWERTRN